MDLPIFTLRGCHRNTANRLWWTSYLPTKNSQSTITKCYVYNYIVAYIQDCRYVYSDVELKVFAFPPFRYHKKKYLQLQQKFMSGTRRYRNIKHKTRTSKQH